MGYLGEIVLEGSSGIEDIQVAEMVKGNEIGYQRVERGRKGDSNIFSLEEDKDRSILKYFPSRR